MSAQVPAANVASAARAARAPRRVAVPACPVCGGAGETAYEALSDMWFGAGGEWNMRRCAGGGCGSLYLDPAPHPDDVALLYERYYTHPSAGGEPAVPDVLGAGFGRRLRRAYLSWRYGYVLDAALPDPLGPLLMLLPGRREHLDLSMHGLSAAWRGRLLDVGCGGGATLRLMSALGWDAQGIDPDERAIAVARAAGLNARRGTLAQLQAAGERYLVVTANHVIEHVIGHDGGPREFLERCFALTSPGGRLSLITPNARSLGLAWLGARWRGLEPPRHVQIFSPSGLVGVVRAAGYREIRVRTSARLAAMIVRESLRPALAGEAGPGRAGLPLRTLAGGFQVLERLAITCGLPLGEELVLTARRPGAGD